MGWRSSRWLRVLSVTVLLVASASFVLWADKLSTERLIERATNDLVPEFREANAKALVAGYIILGRPLDELVGPAQEGLRRGYYELWNALRAGRQGDYIDICYHPQEVEDYVVGGRHLSQMSDEDLEWVTYIEGYSTEVRQAAATLLVQRAIEEAGAKVGVQISSWYAFRVEYEHDPFDPLKIRLQNWQSWGSLGESPELAAATTIPLAQMYLAEHFVWWEQDTRNPERGRYHDIIQTQLECPDDE
ncbi:MAG: hypothetical protein ACE5LQ_01935 [Candidatus Bipolaricaulia bacterium]